MKKTKKITRTIPDILGEDLHTQIAKKNATRIDKAMRASAPTDSFDRRVSKAEMNLIRLIAQRGANIIGKDVKSHGKPYDTGSAEMDLIATHKNGCPLDLESLLTATDHDFGHDLFGINRFLNRETGELKSAFLPRHSKRRGD